MIRIAIGGLFVFLLVQMAAAADPYAELLGYLKGSSLEEKVLEGLEKEKRELSGELAREERLWQEGGASLLRDPFRLSRLRERLARVEREIEGIGRLKGAREQGSEGVEGQGGEGAFSLVPPPDRSPAQQEVPTRPRVEPEVARWMSRIGSAVLRSSRRHGLEVGWVLAIIKAESEFDPGALSPKGARGLLQVMGPTAESEGIAPERLWDVEENIEAGCRVLARLKGRFPSMELATAAYNAGEFAVERYGGRIPPYRETERFVERVMKYYRGEG